MFRMIPAAVALAAATTLALPLSAQAPAQQTPAPAAAAPTTPAQTPSQPPVVTPVIPPPTFGAPDTPTQQPPTRSLADTEFGTAIVLLERVQKVLDDASNEKTGSVTLDRGVLDEIRAEVTQARLTLKSGKP